MVIRVIEGESFHKTWVPLSDMSPHLARAVIAAEDNRFCEHTGVDWAAVETVFQEYRTNGRLRGASTVSMQTTKNLYLWPSRSVLRKALEVVLVQGIESAWSKERIIEVYLNIAEMGAGIYGVEAASQHYWGVAAGQLNVQQAAALISILPSPRRRNPLAGSPATASRVKQIKRSIDQLGSMLDCVPAAHPARRRAIPKETGPVDPESSSSIPAPAQSIPVHFQPEDTEGQNQAAPNEPRRRKKQKVRSKRRRRTR